MCAANVVHQNIRENGMCMQEPYCSDHQRPRDELCERCLILLSLEQAYCGYSASLLRSAPIEL